nr:reverse transcriptase domain-containing protein [Tanacetum cinerariifolium]
MPPRTRTRSAGRHVAKSRGGGTDRRVGMGGRRGRGPRGESRKIKRYVYGLVPQIRRMVAATEPKTMQKAVQILGALTNEAIMPPRMRTRSAGRHVAKSRGGGTDRRVGRGGRRGRGPRGESRKIKRYVYGLVPQIRRMVAATEPKTMQKAVQILGALTNEAVRNG